MKAQLAVEMLKEKLVDAGFDLRIAVKDESEIHYHLVTSSGRWYSATETFTLIAKKSTITNRWSKFFFYTQHGLGYESIKESNMTLRDMVTRVQIAIQNAKVGA